MIIRHLYPYIRQALQNFPCVALLGPRQVGKTTLALEVGKEWIPSPIYSDLERPSDLVKLSDPEYYLRSNFGRLVILDEIQRVPDLFPVLRSMVDEQKRQGKLAGQYLLLGSASRDLLKQSSESLAGRICYIDLTGFNLSECGQDHQDTLWQRGGFPESFLAANDRFSSLWRKSFIRTYIERDIPFLGPKIESETLRRFWTMMAHNQGELLNGARLATNLGVSTPTIFRYLDIFSDLFLIRILRPWYQNVGKRLVKSPKVYIRDSGVLHTLLQIETLDSLLSHPVVGGSWEGFVIENIASILNNRMSLWYYRTAAGAEIDLLIENGHEKIAVEIKRSLAPVPSKGFYNAIQDLDISKAYIVYPGHDQYSLTDNVEVISLAGILQKFMAPSS
jgi:predicted AAA+ superfamily ATPase